MQDCDRIIVLDKGKVIESGTHNALIKNNGFYKKIFDIQVLIEDEIKHDTEDANSETKPVKHEKSLLGSKAKVKLNPKNE